MCTFPDPGSASFAGESGDKFAFGYLRFAPVPQSKAPAAQQHALSFFSRTSRCLKLLFACAGPVIAGAAEPALTHVFPAGVQRGTSTSVTTAGKFDPWPSSVWIDTPGVTFTPGSKAGVFNVNVSAAAAPGPHLIRVFNGDGASAPRFLIVSAEPEVLEIEPNDKIASPQRISGSTVTINGRLDKSGDVDSFALALKQGQTVVAWLDAYVLGSAVDAMLRVVDAGGNQLAFNHDARTLDPFLAFTPPRDGTYIIQAMGFAYPASSDVRLTGGENCVYRLHFSTGPFVHYTLPLAVQAGKKTSMEVVAWNHAMARVEIDASNLKAGGTILPEVPGFRMNQRPALSDIPELVENEGRNDLRGAQAIDIPAAISGRIDPAGDEDRYTFTAVKDSAYQFAASCATFDSFLDAWLKVEDKDGKEVARSADSGGSADARLKWTAPADGVFTVALGDVTQRGGNDFYYRLAITHAQPSVKATASSHSVMVHPGKSAEVKVTVKLENGYNAKLKLTAKNLPAGILAAAVDVPEKGGEVTLTLAADAAAKPAGQPFRLILREVERGMESAVRFPLTTSSEDNGVPQGYTQLVIDSTDQIWITVAGGEKK